MLVMKDVAKPYKNNKACTTRLSDSTPKILRVKALRLGDQRAEAPEIISTSSIVILACLAVLYCNLSLSTISPAFLEAFSIAAILALCSEAKLFKNATHKFDEM